MTDAFDNPVDVGDEVVYVGGTRDMTIDVAVITRISGTRVYMKCLKSSKNRWFSHNAGTEFFGSSSRIISKAVFDA